jgi:hypothetical protein
MEVYKNEFWTIFYENESDLLMPVYDPNSSNLTQALYKADMEHYAQIVNKFKPKRVIVDCHDFYFPITPDIQEWIDKTIFPKILSSGVKYVAIVVPSELITNLSVQQAMEEPEGTKFQTRYFDNREDAKEWLLSK